MGTPPQLYLWVHGCELMPPVYGVKWHHLTACFSARFLIAAWIERFPGTPYWCRNEQECQGRAKSVGGNVFSRDTFYFSQISPKIFTIEISI